MIFYSATITMLHAKLANQNILIKGGIKQERKLAIEHLILKMSVPLGNPSAKIHTKNKHNSQIPVDFIKDKKLMKGITLCALMGIFLLATVSIYHLSRCITCISIISAETVTR